MYRNQPITVTIYAALPAYVIAALLDACDTQKKDLGEHVAELLQFHVDLAAQERAAMARMNEPGFDPLVSDDLPPFNGPFAPNPTNLATIPPTDEATT